MVKVLFKTARQFWSKIEEHYCRRRKSHLTVHDSHPKWKAASSQKLKAQGTCCFMCFSLIRRDVEDVAQRVGRCAKVSTSSVHLVTVALPFDTFCATYCIVNNGESNGRLSTGSCRARLSLSGIHYKTWRNT